MTVVGIFHYVRGRPAWRAPCGGRVSARSPTVCGSCSRSPAGALGRGADLVHTQGWEFAPLGLVAVACLRLAGVPVVQTAHNTFERGRPLERTRSWLARADGADDRPHRSRPGPRAAAPPRSRRGDPARRIRRRSRARGGDADRDGARAAVGLAPEAPVTLLFGQLRADKGLGDLLTALVRLPRLHLLVGGQEEGALAAARAQLATRALAGRVTVREGFLEMAEAAKLFAATDTVALPYAVASQSGVLLLAYGFRRPVVVYPVGGLVEAVIDGETGWICARADVDALVGALGGASRRAGRSVAGAERPARARRGALRVAGDSASHRGRSTARFWARERVSEGRQGEEDGMTARWSGDE